MRRPLLAAAFALAAGLAWSGARADEGAYGSLVGAARSAAEDAGPDLGGSPAADGILKDALNSPVRAPRAVRRSAAPRRAEAEGAVAQPEAPAPRLWTRLYAALTPSWHAVPSLAAGPAVSSATVRTSIPGTPLARLAAANAGERRGLAELISSFPAPDDAQ